MDAGAIEIGENYLQEAIRKNVFALRESRGVAIRYIGRLQSNKYHAILRLFDAVDSADSRLLEHLCAIESRRDLKAGTLLLQVNAGEESQKGGLTVPEIRELAAAGTPWLREISGLMAVVPLEATMKSRAVLYRSVSELFLELVSDLGPSKVTLLSMGTSDDYELAIEHGSNMIRVGTGIFGARPPFQV
ncbi:MAG: alanine racemase [Caldiserica bacterium]|nr:alanine racemase [Caldisericota bacterium]